MHVLWGGDLARREPDAAHPDPDRSGGAAEVGPFAVDVVVVEPVRLDLVEVSDPHGEATLCHRLSESRRTPFDRFLRPLTSFESHPCLGRLDEAAQLLDHGAGGCA